MRERGGETYPCCSCSYLVVYLSFLPSCRVVTYTWDTAGGYLPVVSSLRNATVFSDRRLALDGDNGTHVTLERILEENGHQEAAIDFIEVRTMSNNEHERLSQCPFTHRLTSRPPSEK